MYVCEKEGFQETASRDVDGIWRIEWNEVELRELNRVCICIVIHTHRQRKRKRDG